MKYVAVLALGVSGGTDKLIAELNVPDLRSAKEVYRAGVEAGELPEGLTIMDRRIYDALHGAQTNAQKIRAIANKPRHRRRST